MAKIATFRLTGAREGKTMSLLHYNFVDGELKATESDAVKMRTNLCEFYKCDLSFEEQKTEDVEDEANPDASLAKSNTLTGEAGSADGHDE